MANLARQEIYFQRFFSLDELSDAIDAVTADDILEISRASFQTDQIALTVLGSPEGPPTTREHLVC